MVRTTLSVLSVLSVVNNMTIKKRQCPQTRIMELEEENAMLRQKIVDARVEAVHILEFVAKLRAIIERIKVK